MLIPQQTRHIQTLSSCASQQYQVNQLHTSSDCILIQFENLRIRIMADEAVPPSKVQQFTSELFRLQLCRNDDFKLVCSSLLKPIAKTSKLMSDLAKREEERVIRENEILKELTLVVFPTFQLVWQFTRKNVRKMLTLIL